LGRAAGLADDDLVAVQERRYSSLSGDESLIATLTDALVVDGDLEDGMYRSAVAVLGPAGLFELTALVGYYTTLALQLRIFRVEPPPRSVEGGPA
jgi:4-carboxymuconolactone decarboxylase